jgi:hypothetical protein
MILQEAIRARIRNGIDMFPPQFHEVVIIPLLNKDVFAVVPAIVDVIELSEFKRRWILHGDIITRSNRPDRSPQNLDRLTPFSSREVRSSRATLKPVRSPPNLDRPTAFPFKRARSSRAPVKDLTGCPRTVII